jgi:hypothetical protein
MGLNRFFLGVLIINIILTFELFIIGFFHPELFNVWFFIFLFAISIVGIIVNCFNAFPKDEVIMRINPFRNEVNQ